MCALHIKFDDQCLWAFWALGGECLSFGYMYQYRIVHANNQKWQGVCWIHILVLATIGGCISVGDYIEIRYMLPTIWGVCTSCYVSVGPSRKPVLSGGFSDFSLNW